MAKLNETQYKQILDAVLASDNGPKLSEEKVIEMLDFYEKNYEPIKKSVVKFINSISNISVDDLIRGGEQIIRPLQSYSDKLENTLYEFKTEIDDLDSYLMDIRGELYDRSDEIKNKFDALHKNFDEANLIFNGVDHLVNIIVDNEINLAQQLDNPIEIDEKFASKAQQKYFYARANDPSLSKKERSKWKSMAGEFSSKTDFSHLPNKA